MQTVIQFLSEKSKMVPPEEKCFTQVGQIMNAYYIWYMTIDDPVDLEVSRTQDMSKALKELDYTLVRREGGVGIQNMKLLFDEPIPTKFKQPPNLRQQIKTANAAKYYRQNHPKKELDEKKLIEQEKKRAKAVGVDHFTYSTWKEEGTLVEVIIDGKFKAGQTRIETQRKHRDEELRKCAIEMEPLQVKLSDIKEKLHKIESRIYLDVMKNCSICRDLLGCEICVEKHWYKDHGHDEHVTDIEHNHDLYSFVGTCKKYGEYMSCYMSLLSIETDIHKVNHKIKRAENALEKVSKKTLSVIRALRKY